MFGMDLDLVWLLSLILVMTFSFFVYMYNSTIFAVLNLILIYLVVGFLMINFGLDFLGIILILIYVGGVIVLFVFTVSVLGYRTETKIKLNKKYKLFLWLFFFIFSFFTFLIFCPLSGQKKNLTILKWESKQNEIKNNDGLLELFQEIDNIKILGNIIFENYFFLILIIGLILFTVMVATISILLNNKTIKKNG